jgi:aspartyl-tRNA(Asn)/glutamyl-tRNA(Gln) amidotransferase subunit A
MATFSTDIFFAGIAELGARMRKKEFSSVELVRAFCDRLEKLGPRYNALALSLREDALKLAWEADGDIHRDRARSPLTGIPFGAKDLLAYPRHPTTWGAKPYVAQVLDDEATALVKLRKAGAVLIGKLSMVELAGGGGYRFPAASLQGPGLNPWDRTRWSGGSSSGSGSAVAAGLVPFALGSETSGSILTPAAFCGITGLRPTYGLVSRSGAMALSWTLDKIGPMARSAEDCGLVLQALAGGDSDDPGSAGKRFFYTPQYAPKLGELKVGFAPADFSEWPEAAARPVFEKALAAVRALGLKLVESKLPDFPYSAAIGTIISAEGAAIFEELIRSGQVDQLADKRQIAGLKAGLEIPAHDYLKAMRIRRLVQEAFRRLFLDCDLLLAPSRQAVASKVGDPLDRPATGTPASPAAAAPPPPVVGFRQIIAAANLAGLPAISLPCGFAEGLPLGISLVGPPWSENTLLAAGVEFQKRTDFHTRRPPG